MDYDQANQMPSASPSVAPNFELDSFNLDTNEWQVENPSRDPRTLGANAISGRNVANGATSPNAIPATPINGTLVERPAEPELVFENPNSAPELGRITDAMPPGYAPAAPQYPANALQSPATLQGAAAPTQNPGDTFSTLRDKVFADGKITIQDSKAIDAELKSLDTTGDIASFYEQVRTEHQLQGAKA